MLLKELVAGYFDRLEPGGTYQSQELELNWKSKPRINACLLPAFDLSQDLPCLYTYFQIRLRAYLIYNGLQDMKSVHN